MTQWDDKFGLLEGVGKDAPIVTNDKGGKQSESPMALHLIDPEFLYEYFDDLRQSLEYLDAYDCTKVDKEDIPLHSYYNAIVQIAEYMKYNDERFLDMALDSLEFNAYGKNIQTIIKIGKVLQYGATKGNNGNGYPVNNWRLIPQEEHINHALIHIVAAIMGDKQDNHIDHAMCRLMMAKATKKSEGFEYGAYVDSKCTSNT